MNVGTRSDLATKDDAGLLADVARGDLSGLARLFDRHAGAVRRFVARLGVPGEDLDDIVQQTFLDVVRLAARFVGDGPARPWIFGLAAMHVRRRRRAVARAFARLQRWACEPREATVPSAAEQHETSAEAARARAALERLDVRKRETFVLVVLENMTCAEAASALDVPVATVWSRLHYARAELRAMLEAGQ